MEKSKMMHGYEQETGKMSMMLVSQISGVTPSFPTEDYIAWLEAKANISDDAIEAFQEIIRTQCDEITALKEKAEAYDRLMSGGRKTLKEWANFLGKCFAVDPDGFGYSFGSKPIIKDEHWWPDGDRIAYSAIRPDLIDFNGDWKNSLTLPDGWEE